MLVKVSMFVGAAVPAGAICQFLKCYKITFTKRRMFRPAILLIIVLLGQQTSPALYNMSREKQQQSHSRTKKLPCDDSKLLTMQRERGYESKRDPKASARPSLIALPLFGLIKAEMRSKCQTKSEKYAKNWRRFLSFRREESKLEKLAHID